VSSTRLTETSYAVLGLLETCEPATPYQLKRLAQKSIFHFWTIPHTQLYTECSRLADAGLLNEERETAGRRRRVYRLSTTGREALSKWRENPETDLYELRDPGLLKLFCGADPAAVADAQLPKHEQRRALYEQLLSSELPEGARLSLQAGLGHEQEYIRFWTGLRSKG
jgi:PadR family transcriptional regulator, regulatory protein AphA